METEDSEPGFPSAREAVGRSLLKSTALVAAAGWGTQTCINALSHPGSVTEGTGLLLATVALHIVLVLFLYRGALRETLAVDAARDSAVPDPETLERGFARVVNLPRFWAIRCFAWFVVGGLNLSILRHFLAPEAFPWGQVAIRMIGTTAGAFVYASLLFFLLKREFGPLRDALTRELASPALAREAVQRVPMRAKLVLGVAGALLVALLYGGTLAHVRALRTAEAAAVDLGGAALESADDPAVLETARRLGVLGGVVEIDPTRDPELTALADRLAAFEIAYLLEQGLEAGDSRHLDSPHHFVWRLRENGRLFVSVSPAERFARYVPSWSGATGLFLVLVLVATFAIAWLLAADTERAVRFLSGELDRMASGDLRRGEVRVREDELGDLGLGLQNMATRLGAMIVNVRGTADRVDAAAGEIAAASDDLLATSEEQQTGAQTLRSSLLGVTGQVEGISATARELTEAVQEGSASIDQLGSSGQHLDESATQLSGKVEEVASSIAELIRSVRDVLDNAEHLSGAAVDTSSSMEEMAASLREVDTNAVETARLSQAVVERAEDGREKVRETLRGMEGIRETSETARTVIRSLGARTHEIGAIVNVIDDVAEETNLLALNAAIIAAQAGENGRAFSVVADEIKKLADRVLTSTKEIEGVIRSVQDEAANAVGAMEQGAAAVESGVGRAAEAGQALDAINESARDAGARIGEIVAAVNEQTRASGHVVSLMDRVRTGVDEIRRAGQEQDRGNESILATTEVMSDIARRVRATTGEQAEGARRISDGVDAVREAVLRISAALSEQSVGCGAAEAEVRELETRTGAHGELAHALEASVQTMRSGAERLREAVGRFRV